jgi:pyruvate/2-oxoglutarate dehydrogenase complex dihydrolipoamide dehydrogenase (E3) component
MPHYDAVIIGAGQAGEPLAHALAKAGRKTALIERGYLGGTCVNHGCTPVKTMAASARIVHLARRAREFGVDGTEAARVNLAAVIERKRKIVQDSRRRLEKGLTDVPNLELIKGEAHFTAAKALLVSNATTAQEITADHIFINVGTRPSMLPIEGIDRVRVFDETSLMEIETLPEHLVILGGGYIGVEFAQMFRRFGSQVTLIEAGEQILQQEDRDVADDIANVLRGEDVRILLNTKAERVTTAPDGNIELYVSAVNANQTLRCTHLLMAVGRTPNTDSLNLDAAGIATDDEGYIRTGDRLETNIAGVYALGDVKGGPAFTHIAYDDYRIICRNLLNGGGATITDRILPYVVFTDPPLGRVGMNEQQAREAGRSYKVVCLPMSSTAIGEEYGETQGYMKALMDPTSEHILGCAIFGYMAGEVMSQLQIAMMGNLPYTALRDGIFAHPSLAEAFNNLFTFEEDES